MGKPKAPTPPDPIKTAGAQTGTSVSTAIANTNLGNVNQVGPGGSLTYAQTGTTKFTDPTTGQTYNIPKTTATTRLNPTAQQTFNQNQSAQLGMAKVANSSADRLGTILGQDFNTDGIPEMGKLPGTNDFSADRLRVEQAIMDRMAPAQAQERERLDTQLANQGVDVGSRAFGAAQGIRQQGENDARLGAILAGGQEQSRMFDMGLRGASAQDGQRAQALSERFAQRNQPINEITALLSGSQVGVPNFQVNKPSPIATTDVAGLVNQNYGQQQQNYQTAMANWQGGIGGMFGLGSAFLGMPR